MPWAESKPIELAFAGTPETTTREPVKHDRDLNDTPENPDTKYYQIRNREITAKLYYISECLSKLRKPDKTNTRPRANEGRDRMKGVFHQTTFYEKGGINTRKCLCLGLVWAVLIFHRSDILTISESHPL